MTFLSLLNKQACVLEPARKWRNPRWNSTSSLSPPPACSLLALLGRLRGGLPVSKPGWLSPLSLAVPGKGREWEGNLGQVSFWNHWASVPPRPLSPQSPAQFLRMILNLTVWSSEGGRGWLQGQCGGEEQFPSLRKYRRSTIRRRLRVIMGILTVTFCSEVKASACNAGDLSSIPGLGRSPGEGNGNPLQCSCLENPMDRGAWWAIVHGVAKSWTWLSDFTFFLSFTFHSFLQNIFLKS